MSKSIKISIPNPCKQDINTMSVSQQGYFCDSCQKEVVDFRKFSDTQIQTYFLNIGNKKVCGAFLPSQITTPTNLKNSNWFFGTISKFSFFMFLMLQKLETQAQTQSKQPTIQTEIKKVDETNPTVSDSTDSEITVSGVVLLVNHHNSLATIKGGSLHKCVISITNTNIQKVVDLDGKFNFTVDISKYNNILFEHPNYISRNIELDKFATLNKLIIVLYPKQTSEIKHSIMQRTVNGDVSAVLKGYNSNKFSIRRLWHRIFR